MSQPLSIENHTLRTGAEILLECLVEQGVTHVFGYPGASILGVYDALPAYEGRITHILSSHEQHAAHAADGYARATGKPGVVFATSGPGATNLLTGIAAAYMDSVPLVAVTCNVATSLLGKDSFQEVDIAGVTMPVTKHSLIVKNIHSLADAIRNAFRIALSGRQGPVLIDIPRDVIEGTCDFAPKACPPPKARLLSDEVDVLGAAALIQESRKPVILAGGGVNAARGGEELLALANLLKGPVACTLMGLGSFPQDHPGYLGMMGMYGEPWVEEALAQADLVIAIGTRFSERSVPRPDTFAPQARVLHIDRDAAEVNKNVPASLSLVGDARLALAALLPLLTQREQGWFAKSDPVDPVAPPPAEGLSHGKVLDTLARLAGPDQIYTTDVGQHQLWAAKHLPIRRPRQLLTSGGLGAMGFGLGAAVGAAFATGERIVCITGDGGLTMNMQELSTIAAYDLPVVVVLLNNGTLGMVRQSQQVWCGGRFSQVELNRPTDFPALAKAMGLPGERVTQPQEAEAALARALGRGRGLVEFCISPHEAVLPMNPGNGDHLYTLRGY